MRTIAPPKPDFDSYITRPDTVFIMRENEPLEDLYGAGYLPYSSSEGLRDIFYSARSARVALQEFALTSENRRIARKFDGQFAKRRVPPAELAGDGEFSRFVTEYFAQRHGPRAMPRERLELIMASGIVSSCLVYQMDGKTAGCVLEAESGPMRHYWYSAYDLSLAKQSLGLWLMLDAITEAKDAGFRQYYLGTVYGQKALYKTNFEPLEWHDGAQWSRDLGLLKERSRQE